MGVNTIHNKTNDLFEAYNKTKNKWFRCEILGAKECRKIEIAKGLAPYQIVLTIKINGNVEIDEEDKIVVCGKTLKVNTYTDSFDNPLMARKRCDYAAFTGSKIVGLE